MSDRIRARTTYSCSRSTPLIRSRAMGRFCAGNDWVDC
jgi:hypothetical protein